MKRQGLNKLEVKESREIHGSNELTQKDRVTFLEKIIEGFKDAMLIVLIVALVIQLVLTFVGRTEWYEPAIIFVVICIANFVGVFSESKQEDKAQELKEEALSQERVKVYRDGELTEIKVNDVVVGDIVYLQSGDKVPSDGRIVEGEVKVDQSSLNGESDEVTKTVSDGDIGNKKDTFNPFYLFRGTVITNNECLMEVEEVGDSTQYGELALEMQEETRDTPLKVKLGVLAKQIAKFGYIGASVIAIGYLIQTLVLSGQPLPDVMGLSQVVVDAISLAVVIVVMAVPEGLPMMITLVLSMNMGKMMKDNVLVRKLNGIETAGGINILFSDKTGTITEGKLSVVEIVTGDLEKITPSDKLDQRVTKDIVRGIGINNSSSITKEGVVGGNSTDRALMAYLLDNKQEGAVDKNNVKKFNAFDSSKKYSSVEIEDEGRTKVYIKGAPEKIILRCTKYIDSQGEIKEIKDKNLIMEYMDKQANRSMRLIGVALGDSDKEDEELTLIGVISIRDDVRPEAIQAIKSVQNSGVQVVMVTGDRKETAMAIAKESGVIVSETDIVMTSEELNEKTDDEIKDILPNLRVVARALPTDKSRLVRIAQELDLVVGMTGDGVNDAPALKIADVGFAMGSGTEVAKEAGDITILDDNFTSIAKAILYGRTIFKSIRRFIIFQLTVNVAAVTLCFITPFMGIAQPISIVSLLYINLVMDTLAALAFGGEPALEEYMKEKPISRSESIVTKYMSSQILVIGVYIVVVSLLILLNETVIGMYAKNITEVSIEFKETSMLVFFMLTVVLNGFYARTEKLNVFGKMGENKQFGIVMLGVVLLLVVLVEGLGKAAGLTSIPITTWGIMALFAMGSIPIDMIRKTIIKSNRR